jgi:hypothetical protein
MLSSCAALQSTLEATESVSEPAPFTTRSYITWYFPALRCFILAVTGPVAEPAPFYQPEADCVLAWHDASYSQHSWQLPRLLLPHPDESSRAAVFAAALLAGKVLPCMGGLAGVLVAPAATAARQELQGLPRVGELLTALQSRKVRELALPASYITLHHMLHSNRSMNPSQEPTGVSWGEKHQMFVGSISR